MDETMDPSVTELLISRLCHDIVGPIGAVNNGLELMADDDLGMADDALELASRSAGQATTLLQFFRLAYGSAGLREVADSPALQSLAADFLAHEKASLDWPPSAAPLELPEGSGKLVLNMIALAAEALPRGGSVAVALHPGASIEVAAQGEDVGFRQEVEEGLAESVAVEELTPRSVHGYFTRQVARRLGGELRVEHLAPGSLRLTANLPG